MSARVLVTGGSGFIGQHLLKALSDTGHFCVSLDLIGFPPSPLPGTHYVKGDARDLNHVERILKDWEISVVYHLAATVSVPLCQENPMESYSHNLGATLSVLTAIRNITDRKIRFIFASSAALYGNQGDDRHALSESEVAKRFNSFYAAQKHASEKAVEIFNEHHQIPSLIFRFFNVYGPGQKATSPYSGVITKFRHQVLSNKNLVLENGGTQTRDFISVSEVALNLVASLDVAEHLWTAIPINLGFGVSTSISELAQLFLAASPTRSSVTQGPMRQGDVLHSLADISRARSMLGYHPKLALAKGLDELMGNRSNFE